jgi:hypothetical protein
MSSSDIRDILSRLSSLEESQLTPVSVKHGLNKQQKKADQLPALFKPKNISTTLTKKPYQKHPMDGKLVGDSVEPKKNPLEEAMQEVEEDMLSKVKSTFVDYLERLEDKNKIDSRLVRKAKAELNIDDDPQTEEVEDGATWDADVAPPSDPGDTETAHGLEDHIAAAVSQPAAPVATMEMVAQFEGHDGIPFECWGNNDQGYEIRRQDKSLPTRFKSPGEAEVAVKLFQQRRKKQQDLTQDYIEER